MPFDGHWNLLMNADVPSAAASAAASAASDAAGDASPSFGGPLAVIINDVHQEGIVVASSAACSSTWDSRRYRYGRR